MGCKNQIFWYNLPNTIKNKVKVFDMQLSTEAKNITWYNLPNKLTKLYDELAALNLPCKKEAKFMWYNLPRKAEAICDLIDCLTKKP